MPKKFSIPRNKYSIKSKKQIEKILSDGNKILEYPILLKWIPDPEQDNFLKIAFIISKKKIHKATKRNLIRRRLRESLRLILPEILPELKDTKPISALIIYLADKPLPYPVISEKLNLAFERLFQSNLNNSKKNENL